jgi:hypothetical protein
MRWLRSLRFDDRCAQPVFVDYLAGVVGSVRCSV